MNTEEHPLEYVDFEDVIPEGNYGAGPMIAWDVGRSSYLSTAPRKAPRPGRSISYCTGTSCAGVSAWCSTKRGSGNEWLLLKKRDENSRKEGDILVEQPESVLSGLTVDSNT